MTEIRRALVSVSDKTGLIPFARTLRKHKIEILSTGGTLKALRRARIPVRSVSDVTGFPEILEGRVKTLHPKIHGGLLYRRGRKGDEREIKEHGIGPIDLVVVNLYPFEEVVGAPLVGARRRKERTPAWPAGRQGPPLQMALEYIDIGGPTLLRAAAKNFPHVAAVTDPRDYDAVAKELEENKGRISPRMRASLAEKVFDRTSVYDRAIANYLRHQNPGAELPASLDVVYEKSLVLRYGENPHQRGALYRRHGKPRHDFHCLHGKELSFNNLLDTEAAIDVLREFDKVAACVVKHTNPCGIAEGKTLAEAAEKAIGGDPLSAFGGIVGLNRPCDAASAKKIYEKLNFLEVIVAPSFRPEALEFLKTRKNVRLVEAGPVTEGGPWDLRFSKFGILLQDRDRPIRLHEAKLRRSLRCVTRQKVSRAEIDELLFAWKCVKMVRSNAIVIAKDRETVGIGPGQTSRVDAVEIACRKAGDRASGAYLASDAFFPMPDSIEIAQQAGIRAIIQPGGSIRDAEVIEACDRFGLAMCLTGERHFRH